MDDIYEKILSNGDDKIYVFPANGYEIRVIQGELRDDPKTPIKLVEILITNPKKGNFKFYLDPSLATSLTQALVSIGLEEGWEVL